MILQLEKKINDIQEKIKASPTGVSFINFTYTAKSGETSKYLLNVGVDYKKSIQKDIKTLENIISGVESFDTPCGISEELVLKAAEALLNSLKKPNKKRVLATVNSYTILANNIKKHNYLVFHAEAMADHK